MDESEDRTQVVGASDARLAGAGPMPIGRLICSDPSTLEGGIGAEIVLTDGTITVGRSSEANVRIKSSSISRVHAKIYPGAGFWGIKDLGSTNGIKINGEAVEQGWMRNGDSVMIGKVAYAFTQEKPKPKDAEGPSFTDTIVSDRTMFVGQDTSAASALLKATAAAAKPQAIPDPLTEPTANERSRTATRGDRPIPSGAETRGKRSLPLVKVGAGVAVLLAAVGAYFVLFSGDAEVKDAVERNGQLIKRFIARDERTGVVSGEALQQQMDELAQLRAGLAPIAASHPDAVELRELQASVAFLEFSRQFAVSMKSDDLETARRQLAGVTGLVEYTGQTSAKASEGEVGQRFQQIASLLELADASVRLKAFVIKFPDPDSSVAEKPGRDVLDKVLEARQRFAALKKQHNLAVSVTYPYFGAGIGHVGDSDLSLLDRWQRVVP